MEWDEEKWPLAAEADVLGHVLCSDASPWPCWRRTEKSMWASFWKNCVGQSARGLGLAQRSRMLNRSVRPILTFRNTRWPWTRTLADSQNRTQKRMVAYFIHIQRLPSETLQSWHRRRMRKVAEIARQQGTWGTLHAQRVIDWSEHLQRERNAQSLAANLYSWHDHVWLQNRRLDPEVGTGAMRPGTRALPGPVMKRWDEALADAKEFLNNT